MLDSVLLSAEIFDKSLGTNGSKILSLYFATPRKMLLTRFSIVFQFIYKPILRFQSKTNDCFEI